jgi:signal transduction histidine kinase
VTGTTAERLTVLRREVDRMQAVLDEFLAYSRPLVPLDPEDVDVTALAREVVELHEGMAEERGVRLEVVGEPAGQRCDPRKVRAVLINLVQNAIEASPRGEVVRVELARDAGGGLTMHVLDRGLGIDPAIAGRLFTVGATTKAKGNGLGLALARGLARQHGGELVLERREGGGAAAIVTLPAEPTALGAAA